MLQNEKKSESELNDLPADKYICEVNKMFVSMEMGGFHLYLLVFPFVYKFYSIIEALVSSSFANGEFRRISVSFQHHFKIYLL